jgi:hypothetical protein
MTDAAALARAAWRWVDGWTMTSLNPPPHLRGRR